MAEADAEMTRTDEGLRRIKTYAAVSLLCGAALAVGTPAFLMYMAPDLRGYLRRPVLVLLEALPYALCAALWLPWRGERAAKAALVFSLLLLLAGFVLYVPMWLDAGRRGGDMIGLAFAAISIVTTIALLVLSAVAAPFVIRRSSRAR